MSTNLLTSKTPCNTKPGRSYKTEHSSTSLDNRIHQCMEHNARKRLRAATWASVQEIADKQKASDQKIQKLTDMHTELSQKVENLEGSASKQAIRNRFLSCVKQDVHHNHADQDQHHIQAGNGVAHHGNCLSRPLKGTTTPWHT